MDQVDPRIPDNYVIERPLGTGSFGEVYAAFDRKRGRRVALKVLKTLSPTTVYRFKQEFRSLSGLSHPNLATLYELTGEGESWFFTMELVEGVDFLSYALGRRSPDSASSDPSPAPATLADDASPPAEHRSDRSAHGLTPAVIRRLRHGLRQLVQGVHALHQAGKLHRDIKPHNVLVTGDGRVVLLDFGLVTELREDADEAVGTPSYMAPEQVEPSLTSPASDWYSVGVMLYEALTGRRPFGGQSVLEAKQRQDPTPPEVINPDVPLDLSQLCMRFLARDPLARPEGAELLEMLGATDSPHTRAVSTAVDAPFVGRIREIDRLTDAFEASCKHTVVVHLHGNSGIGKTALMRAFVDQLKGRAAVLSGRCYQHESVPFKAVDGLVDRLCDHLRGLDEERGAALLPPGAWALARLFPAFERVRPAEEKGNEQVADRHELRRIAFDALRELLRRLAEHSPLVLVIDDIHWGDLDSAALLADILRPPEPPRMLLVLAYRSEERDTSPVLRVLLGPNWLPTTSEVQELELEPMDDGEAGVAAQILAGMEGVTVTPDQVVREAHGSPLFLQALIRHLAHVEPGGLEAPTLRRVLQDQIDRLTDEARRLLQLVVVNGRPVEEEIAAAAAGGGDPFAVLSVLRAQHLVRVSSESLLEPYHDQIAHTVFDSITDKARRKRHRRLARAHEASGAAPELLVFHWHGAGDAKRAAPYAQLAADRAFEALAFERAARLYRLALELAAPQEVETRHRLQVRLAEALAHSGQGSDAAESFLAAVEDVDIKQARQLRRRAVFELFSCGHAPEAMGILDVMMQDVGLQRPRSRPSLLWFLLSERTRLRLRGLGHKKGPPLSSEQQAVLETCSSASMVLGLHEPVLAAALHTRYLRLALACGDPDHIVPALGHELSVIGWKGTRSGKRLDHTLQLMQDLSSEVDDPLIVGDMLTSIGGLEMMRGRWRVALEHAERASEIFASHGYHYGWDYTNGLTLVALLMLGELGEMARRLPQHLRRAENEGKVLVTASLKTITFLLWLAADQPEEGRRVVRAAVTEKMGAGLMQTLQRVAEVSFDLYEGDAHAALKRQQAAGPVPGLHRIQVARVIALWHQSLATLAVAAQSRGGERRRHLKAARRLGRRLTSEHAPWANAMGTYALGAVAAMRGEKTAPALLEAAASWAEEADMQLLSVGYRRRLGQLLGGDHGQGLVRVADEEAAAQGIKNPERFVAVYAPW